MANDRSGSDNEEIRAESSVSEPVGDGDEKNRVSDYNQKIFQLVVENVEDYAVFVVDAKGFIASWNPGVEKLLGYQEHEFVGKPVSIIFTAEDIASNVPETELRVAASQGKCEDVRWHVRRDGSLFWGNGLMMQLDDEALKTPGFVKIMRDETRRKETEETLKDSEEKYRSIFDSIDEGFCVIEMLFDQDNQPIDYRFLKVNQTFGVQTGLVNAAGKTVRELVPGIEDKWVEIYGTVALTGEPARFENFSQAMNRWFDVYAFRFGASRNNQVALVFRDISRRKRAETEREELLIQIQTEREKLAYLFEQAPAIVAVMRGDEHVFELTNPAFLEMMGRRDIVGKAAREVFPELEKQGFFKLLDHVFQTGKPYRGNEFPILIRRQPDAELEKRFIDFVYQPIFDSDKKVSGIFAHGVDVTEQVSARREAEAATRAKDEFLAMVSHELRTPVNAIKGWNAILKEQPTPELVAKVTEIIERQTDQQIQIIEDLLDTTQILSGKLSLQMTPVDLTRIVASAVDHMRPAAENKKVSLNLAVEAPSILVKGDEARLLQVVSNLLSNAVKFTPEGGCVEVRLERENAAALIIVKDDGIGISRDFLPRVFERYSQADALTRRRGGGLGLGLSLVKQLVEMHGGAVAAKSAGEGKGSCFTVKLPVLN